MAKLVAKTYGEALFEVALEDGVLEKVTKEVKTMLQVLKENKDLSKFISHPKVSKKEKIKVIEQILKGRFSDTLVGFFVLIVEKGRYEEVPSIFNYYMDRVREHMKIGVVWVTSAYALTKKQQGRIEQRLAETTQYEMLEMHYVVDESIIGGLVIRIRDRVVDNSLKSQLKDMTKVLL